MVDGVPRFIIPAVFASDASCKGACSAADDSNDPWLCMLNRSSLERCPMLYTTSSPTNLSDPWLIDWSSPVTIVDGRVDGLQPHGPGFDDTTHAWQDPEDIAAFEAARARGEAHPEWRTAADIPWRFAGQTTWCQTKGCNSNKDGDQPEYLQLWRSKAGSDWSKGFDALGSLFPNLPDNLDDRGILNVPDFWKKEQTGWPLDFVHFGDNRVSAGSQ